MSDRFHVGSRKGLFTYRKSGSGWETGAPEFLGEPVTSVLHDARDGTLYAALALGHFGPKLKRSDDDGKTWTDLTAPAFPKLPDDASDEAKKDAPSVLQLWTLESGGADEPGVIYAGCIPAGLFRSEDKGETWTLLTDLWDRPERREWFGGGFDAAGIHSVLVDPRNSQKLTVGISCGGVWKSEDRGQTWRIAGKGLRATFLPPEQAYYQNTQDPHRLSACAADPDTIWCQHHCGVFVSNDGAETFRELSETFGFGVAAHPKDPASAWFAPGLKDEYRVPVDGRFVVHRTHDHGASFTPKNKGLPTGAAYDLVYRHALAADASGQRLVLGSTTGNLWLSEDGGESYALLSAHLPPIAHISWS